MKPSGATVFRRDPDLPFLEARDSTIAGSPFGVHSHAAYSVGVVESGFTTLALEYGRWPVPAGSVVFLPPRLPHSCNPGAGEYFKYRMLYLDTDWFEAFADGASGLDGSGFREDGWPADGTASRLGAGAERSAANPNGDGPPKGGSPRVGEGFDLTAPAVLDDAHVAQALLDFAAAQDRGAPGPKKLALLTEALSLLVSRPARSLPAPQPRREREAARKAARILAERPAGNISLADLARNCGLSACHLPRVFRQAYAMTPAAYRNQMRVELAKRLLASGATIAQAAAEAGFADQSHLNRAFRRYAGATPGQYRLGSPA